MCIAIVCVPGCDVINFEIILIFQIKTIFYMTKKSRQNFKYLEKEKSFYDEIKSIFKELSVAKNCIRPEGAPLKKDLETTFRTMNASMIFNSVICVQVVLLTYPLTFIKLHDWRNIKC